MAESKGREKSGITLNRARRMIHNPAGICYEPELSVARSRRLMPMADTRTLAIHEAAHAVVALQLGISVEQASIAPDEGTGQVKHDEATIEQEEYKTVMKREFGLDVKL